MADRQKYAVAIEGFILGTFCDAGELVDLTADQAREFLFEGRVTPLSETTAEPDETAA